MNEGNMETKAQNFRRMYQQHAMNQRMEGGQIIDRNLGLISTFEVALPEGTVPLTIRHRSVSVEPAKSELFRLMGAAVWPAAIGTIQVVMDDSDLRQAAAR